MLEKMIWFIEFGTGSVLGIVLIFQSSLFCTFAKNLRVDLLLIVWYDKYKKMRDYLYFMRVQVNHQFQNNNYFVLHH